MARIRRIGLAIEFHLLWKHHTGIFAGLKRFADERGWLTVFDPWIVEALGSSPRGLPFYDGVVARVTADQLGLIDATAALGVPLVNVMLGSSAFDELPGVFPDLAETGRLRAEHLIARGLRHFASISVAERRLYEAQADSFALTVATAGHSITRLNIREDWEATLSSFRQHQSRIRSWMDKWELPIGLAIPSDFFARLFAQLIQARGWRIPEDVAIVGGMNEEQLCESPRPTLTSVEMGFDRIGYEAARLLEELMNEAERARKRGKPTLLGRQSQTAAAQHVILPPVGIVVRESTDFYAAEDELVAQAQAHIAEECHRRLAVTTVAAKLAVSVRTLQERFATVLGRSVSEEIRRVRIEKVKRELTSSDRSVKEIAAGAGFKSSPRLCEAFRRAEGVSPGEYRAKRQSHRDR